MRRRSIFGLLWLLASAIPQIQAQQPMTGKKIAVLIGIKRYDNANFGNLNYTENDVVELAKILKPRGFEVLLLSDSQPAEFQPTKNNILSQLEAALKKRQREDMVIFAFAGHGLQFDKDKASYFLPRDAEPNDAATMISLKKVYEQMEDCGAGAKLLFVDACRNKVKTDRFRGGFDGDGAPSPPNGVCAFFSCSAGQSALEMNDLRHGLFFYHLLEGLRGKARDEEGEITVLSLAQYAMRRVKKAGLNQTPVLKGEVSDGALNLLADDTIDFFNGVNLEGWNYLKEHWSVKNGAIVGKHEGLPFHTYLCSQRKYGDFTLQFKVHLKGNKGNSGIQIRSEVIDDNKRIVAGPQADIGADYWGSLYGERFGGMMKKADKDAVARAVKEDAFNDFSIKAVGKRFTIKINGVTLIDDIFERSGENQVATEGIIAIQLHGREPIEVIFKDFKFVDLSRN